MKKLLLAVLLVALGCANDETKLEIESFGQKFSDLAQTPPMGWNSWNHFQCEGLNEAVVMEMADAMAASGMREAGYDYIVIDDCWQADRGLNGKIIVDYEKFPSGIENLANYIHSKGLKFGLYSDAGTMTCAKRPGSKNYELIDARTYAEWGVDYLKYDWCSTEGQDAKQSYSLMRDALYEAGRPIVFSICEWGLSKPWEWAGDVGHLWRTTFDIAARWDGNINGNHMGWTEILDKQVGLEDYAGPGHWNDPDMLEVGNDGLTINEGRAHFSMWCMLAAPLIAGNDLRNMEPEVSGILLNKELIAINQDPLGKQGYKILDDGNHEVWQKPLDKGDIAIAFLNREIRDYDFVIEWGALPIDGFEGEYKVKDLWQGKEVGTTTIQPRNIIVPARDVVVYRLAK